MPRRESPPQRILLLRTDRIGDVILSTPVALALKEAFPESHITFLVREYTLPIAKSCPAVDAAVALEEFTDSGGRVQIRKLAAFLRSRQFDVAIHLFPRPALALASWLARIPLRIGTGYRFYSLLFNARIFEHRKTAQRHEAEYNLQLLRPLGLTNVAVRFALDVSQSACQRIDQWLAEAGIRPEHKLVVLHPGSGGSARDWPPGHFAELLRKLHGLPEVRVAMTGSAEERELVGEIIAQSGVKPLDLCGRLSFEELAALLRRAEVFVANSTGPLHLSVALGTEVVAFYPPIRACRPERWGPYGRREDVLMSRQEECYACRRSYDRWCRCMAEISVDQAFAKIGQKLRRGAPPVSRSSRRKGIGK